MAAICKNLGLELPEYVAEKPIAWTKDDIYRCITEATTPIFVRRAYLDIIGQTTLRGALNLADETFATVAEQCGAQFSPPHWGLAAIQEQGGRRYHASYHDDMMPKGYALVAEVPIIHSASPLNVGQYDQVMRGLHAHRQSGKPVWLEDYPHAFIQGIAPDATETQIHLVDIDPIIGPPNSNTIFLG